MTAATSLRLRYFLHIGVFAAMLVVATPVLAQDSCAALIEQSNAQLETMRRHAAAIQASVEELNMALRAAEQRNLEQTRHIERLQAELRARRSGDPEAQRQQRLEFFRALRRDVPVSSLYEVLPDRLIIAADPVFVFGTGELGAEGQDRLRSLVGVLAQLLERLPEEFPWRVRIEGHSDSRPLRSDRKFDNNWQLSSARALGFLQFLVSSGIAEERLSAVGLAATRLRDPGESKAAHRRNRRIELHLVYVDADGDESVSPGR